MPFYRKVDIRQRSASIKKGLTKVGLYDSMLVFWRKARHAATYPLNVEKAEGWF